MAEQYIYAVARVRSRELSLLTESVIAQLCAASNEEDCLRILSERGWGNSDVPGEEMFSLEHKKTWEFIREIVPDQMQVFDVFRVADDYHNLVVRIAGYSAYFVELSNGTKLLIYLREFDPADEILGEAGEAANNRVADDVYSHVSFYAINQ